MSAEKPFSLAVVKGPSRGQVLRTERKRISVGSARDNDLVLTDPEIAARHFLVLIEQGSWRIHTVSANQSLTVDRRWSHPTSGRRGAVIRAAGSEILLFPGHLEDRIIELELRARTDDPIPVDVDNDGATKVAPNPLDARERGDVGADRSADRTSAYPAAPELRGPAAAASLARAEEPTHIGEMPRAPEHRRGPVAPSVLRDRGGREVKAWDEATMDDGVALAEAERRAKRRDAVPEVVPDDDTSPHRPQKGPPPPPPADPARRPASPAPQMPRNAWGDPVDRTSRSDAPEAPNANAWGDPAERRADPAERRADPAERRADPAERRADPASSERRDTAEPGRRGDAPRGEGPRSGWNPNERALEKRSLAGLRVTIEELNKRPAPELAILREPDGELATAVRLLGTKLEGFMQSLGYRAYMMTSPEPLAGKTTVSCNLAFALAEDTHRRVALVEANFRHPRLGEVLGVPEGHGLVPVLDGRSQLADMIVKVSDRNLVIVPAGGKHPHPAELLASPRFKTLIAELANTVDIAIIDAPAVTPFADANLLLPLVDSALFVVASHRTHVTWVARAAAQLGPSRVLGAVYNSIPKKEIKRLRRSLKDRMKQGA